MLLGHGRTVWPAKVATSLTAPGQRRVSTSCRCQAVHTRRRNKTALAATSRQAGRSRKHVLCGAQKVEESKSSSSAASKDASSNNGTGTYSSGSNGSGASDGSSNGASNGSSNGASSNGNGAVNSATVQKSVYEDDGSGKGKVSKRDLVDVLRKEEQSDFVASQEAAVIAGGIPSDNTPNPASSWLPHTDQPTPVVPREGKIDALQRVKALREKLCTVPEFVKSQAAYRVQQLMLSNTIVKLLAVFVFATPAVLIGGQVYSLLQPNTSLWQGFLKIYSVLYIIPGVNVLEETNALSFILVNIIFLVGTFTFAVVLGVVSDDITTEVKAIRSGNYPVLTEGHILLLNWNRQTVPLLRQLALTSKEQLKKGRDIVVLAEKEKNWMDGEMKEALKGYNLSWQSREGSPYAAADLTRVSAGSAAMIVLMRPESDQCPMQDVAVREVAAILSIHSQRDSVRSHEKHRQSMIVQAPEEGADVVTAAKRVLLAGELEALGLRDKRDMSMLIAQSALQPGVASVHCAILQKSPGGVSFFLREFPELNGLDFRDVRRRFADAVICGIFRTKQHFPVMNPGAQEKMEDGDKVIALSNNSRFKPSSTKALSAYQQALDRLQELHDKHPQQAEHQGRGGNYHDYRSSREVADMPPRNIVIAGWCGSMNYLVDGMAAFAPPGSNVTIICECPPEGMPQGELQGVRFNFLPGYPHNTSCLEEAGVREADCIIIGPADDLSDKEADAQLLSMIMLIQDILLDDLRSGERSQNGSRFRRSPTHVVGVVRCAQSVKVANYLVRDLAQNTMTAELLQPDELVSGLIAQVAGEPDLAIVLPLLIDSWEGTEARLREPEELGVGDLRATPFAEVSERASNIGEVAIGFVTRAGSLVLAPSASLEHVYRNTDRIVVFANAQHGARCRLTKAEF